MDVVDAFFKVDGPPKVMFMLKLPMTKTNEGEWVPTGGKGTVVMYSPEVRAVQYRKG